MENPVILAHSIQERTGTSMNITVYLGASNGVDKMYSMEAKGLGEWIGKSGHRLIYGGSRTGLMGVTRSPS